MSADRTSGAALEDELGRYDGSEFLRLLGCHFDEVGPTRLTGWVEVGPQHHQYFGLVHGGLLSSVAESFASIGAWVAVRDSGRHTVGVSNTTDFLRSTTAGVLDVVATALYQGRSQQLWEVAITRAADGKDVARGRVRLQNIEPR
ncbi:MAG: PaaI family thioesterase [Candidatus Dormibacteria bacterium]